MFCRAYLYLDRIVLAGESLLPRDPADEGVVMLLEGEGGEVPGRVPVLIDADEVPGDALVAAHADDGLRDLAA